jgi:putative heme-binding domain-containing protein
VVVIASVCGAAETRIGDHTFTLPDGFEITQVAGPPLVNRPICADFDELGRLYVADSSGLSEKAAVQLEMHPHRIVRLEDTDGDGRFDASVVFARDMMFPEGTLWYDGSLYVAAPPVIWMLTDTDGDGEADQRDVWFDGKTLTGCANDLHGPYLGPDGWIYWCKGAFAEQTYERPGREPLVTRAAHIFRRRPEGGPVEPVMTGGMDNPVEVVFTAGGERIFSTTFLQRPGGGLRDGLIHATYGGVYGKVHGVLEGHPRTGEIMPPLAHLGPAVPCGLLRLETNQLGDAYQGHLLTCHFNTRRVSRHVLTPQGATFATRDEDFLVSDNIDFHPTDVLEDADGSLLAIDTGGWYKMCCPTSNLSKPDILGAIYRVRRVGSHQIADPRGGEIDWTAQTNEQLAALLGDTRIAVRKRAQQALRRRGHEAVAALTETMNRAHSPEHRLSIVWALTTITDEAARSAVRTALRDDDPTVVQAALHAVSVWRDSLAAGELVRIVKEDSPPQQRAAAEGLGRLGSPEAIDALLTAAARPTDRVLEHSLVYALIEIGDAEATRRAMAAHPSPGAQRAALIALDQMPGGDLPAGDVVVLLDSADSLLASTAWWIAEHHPEWAADLVDSLRHGLTRSRSEEDVTAMAARLTTFAADPWVQTMMAELVSDRSLPTPTRVAVVQAMGAGGLDELPRVWSQTLSDVLTARDAALRAAVVTALGTFSEAGLDRETLDTLQLMAGDVGLPPETRLQALAAIPPAQRPLDRPELLEFLCASLSVEQPVAVRATAVDLLVSTPLNASQMTVVATALPSTGPLELQRVLELFGKSEDDAVGRQLVSALGQSPALTALSVENLKQTLSPFGETIAKHAEPLFERIVHDNREKYHQLETVLALLDTGDVRRGQRVFRDEKTACAACHMMGYLGGTVGPDLTRIGRVRSEQDLLEAILFPSASFVRSYEPTTILTEDGQVLNGVIRDETASEITLQLDAQKTIRVPLDEIEERLPGSVSIMPTGLDKQLTPQELADLVVFLKAAQ